MTTDVECLHRIDLTRMTMTSGTAPSTGTFGAVAHIRDGDVITFVLSKPCVVKEITRNGNLVLHVTHPVDRDALVNLQNAFVVLLCALMPMSHRLTCTDAVSIVRHVVGTISDGTVHVLVCVTTSSEEDGAHHRPTRVHLRRGESEVERDVGLHRLRAGLRVYPVFHAPGASLDPACERLVPHLTVSEVIVEETA